MPGAFTPTCSLKHLPGFIEKADELKAKGVETIACVAVNDAFVMDAWGKSVDAGDKVMLLADGSALFTKARIHPQPAQSKARHERAPRVEGELLDGSFDAQQRVHTVQPRTGG